MALNQNLAPIKNSSSLTFQSINIVNNSRGMSRDHLVQNHKLLSNREEKCDVTLPW